jgi:hypothetical protein
MIMIRMHFVVVGAVGAEWGIDRAGWVTGAG